MTKLHCALRLAGVALLLASCAGEKPGSKDLEVRRGSLVVHNALAPAPVDVGDPASQTMSVYMRIENTGNAPDTLLSATADAASAVTLHGTMMHDGHTMMMEQSSIVIPAHGTVDIAPGGTHIMLETLKRAVHEGDALLVTLRFARGGNIAVRTRVVTYQTLEQERAKASGHDD